MRCQRAACPDCLREASVGHQCTDCIQSSQRQQRARSTQYRRAGLGQRTVAGALASNRVIVTPVLIAVNVLIYLITAVQAQDMAHNEMSAVFREGVLWPLGMVAEDEWWRLFTSGFLHYGPLHVGMNMLALWILGRDIELILGRIRYLVLYFGSMLGGSAAVFAFGAVETGTAGASGAIYGLMGAILVAVLRLRLNATPAIAIIVLNIVISVSLPGISLLGHLGGLVIGALLMAAMLYAPAERRAVYQAGAVGLLVVALVGIIVFRDVQLTDQIRDAFATTSV